MANLQLEIDRETRSATAQGGGPVDAIVAAIRRIQPHAGSLDLYQVRAVTAGADAQAEVTVRLFAAGHAAMGRSADCDTLVASARAYVKALNGLLVKQDRSAPVAMSA